MAISSSAQASKSPTTWSQPHFWEKRTGIGSLHRSATTRIRCLARRSISSLIGKSDDFTDDVPLDECQPFVAAEVGICQPVLVEAKLVENRRVDVAEVVWALDS